LKGTTEERLKYYQSQKSLLFAISCRKQQNAIDQYNTNRNIK